MLVRLFSRSSSPRFAGSRQSLTKGTWVVAARDLGEYARDYVCRGTPGVVSAVSRVGTCEVVFDGGTRLSNLDGSDVQAYA